MNVFIASDHGGFELKQAIQQIDFASITGFDVRFIDCGANSTESCDYPIFAKKLVNKLKKCLPFKKEKKQDTFGILICTSGIGMSMVANRYKKIRAGLCRSAEEAKLTRAHNNANVLCLGAKFTDLQTAVEIIKTFLTTDFEGGRHARRIKEF